MPMGRQFKCPTCKRAYFYRRQLEKHIEKRHGIEFERLLKETLRFYPLSFRTMVQDAKNGLGTEKCFEDCKKIIGELKDDYVLRKLIPFYLLTLFMKIKEAEEE